MDIKPNMNLNEKTSEIKKYEREVKTGLFGIARLLLEVKEKKLFTPEYKSVTEYAEKLLEYKRSMVYNLIAVAENFLAKYENRSIFTLDSENDFTMGQLQEMVSLPEKAIDLVNEGIITPDMTAKEIREVIKAEKTKIKNIKKEEIQVKKAKTEKLLTN